MATPRHPLKRRWQALRQHLPTQCWVCGSWPVFSPLCAPCLQKYAAPQLRCGTCALPLPARADAQDAESAAGLPHSLCCGSCLRQPPPLAACWAAVDYAPPWRDLVHRWKLAPLAAQQPAQAQAAAQLMLARLPWAAMSASADVLLPIPPSPQRARWRGFHHTLLLAKALNAGSEKALPIASQLLLRLPSAAAAQPQTRRSRQARLLAMQHAFMVPPVALAQLQGQRVLLLDDVMTTGATLHSAAKALLHAGAAEVRAVVLARTAAR